MVRTILITGAARGLGAALAQGLAADGHRLAIHFRTTSPDITLAAVRKAGGEAEAFANPLATLADGARLAAQVIARFGALDTLINNAGAFASIPFEDLTQQDWDAGLASATAAFAATRACLPHLRASGHGRVVNIGDSAADRLAPQPVALGYYIGKAGLWMMTRTLAATEARHQVTVNMVSPGRLERSADAVPREEMPLGRYGTNDDVLGAVRFLLDDRASALTGSNLIVSGGWNLA